MPTMSAGIVLVRPAADRAEMEFLLVHPGGPFWQRKDLGAWSIPKGEYGIDDDPLATARREFVEELGVPCPSTDLSPLGSVRQAGGKLVSAWMAIGEIDTAAIRSNTFDVEWPPRSGRVQSFPEVDRAEYFRFEIAVAKINPAQVELLERAVGALAERDRDQPMT